jgi:hypothetical protein
MQTRTRGFGGSLFPNQRFSIDMGVSWQVIVDTLGRRARFPFRVQSSRFRVRADISLWYVASDFTVGLPK